MQWCGSIMLYFIQGMIDKLTENGRCYGMEMNVEKTKVMRK